MTQEHTDKKEILDTSQYNNQTKSKTYYFCPHSDNLNNGNTTSAINRNRESRRSSTMSNMDIATNLRNRSISKMDSSCILEKELQRRETSTNKKSDVDSSIRKLNKLKNEIANKLNEVKGVLNKYDNNENAEQQPRSKNEPIKFHFVRRVRRKSSLLDDIEKAQPSRITEQSDANISIDSIRISDLQKVDNIHTKESASEAWESVGERSNSAIEQVQPSNYDSNIPNSLIEKGKCVEIASSISSDNKIYENKPSNRKLNINTFNNEINEESSQEIVTRNEHSSENNNCVKLETNIVIQEPPLAEKKKPAKGFKANKNNMILKNNDVMENRRSSIASTEPSSLKNSLDTIPMGIRRLSDSIAKELADNIENNLNLELQPNVTNKQYNILETPENTIEKSEERKDNSGRSEVDVALLAIETDHTIVITSGEIIKKQSSIEDFNENLDQQTQATSETKPIDSSRVLEISIQEGSDTCPVDHLPLKSLTSKILEKEVEECELPTFPTIVDTTNSKFPEKRHIEKKLNKQKEETVPVTMVKQATPGKIVRRKTPKIKRELSKTDDPSTELVSVDNGSQQTVNSDKELPLSVEDKIKEPILRKPKAKKRVIIRKIKRRLSKDDPFNQDNLQDIAPVTEISEKDIFEEEHSNAYDKKETTLIVEVKPKTILKPREFKEGDIVRYGERFKKTGLRWKKATIIERITSISYKLNINGEEKTVHVGFLKRDNDRKVNFGSKEYLEIDYEQIEEDEEAERNYSIWDRA